MNLQAQFSKYNVVGLRALILFAATYQIWRFIVEDRFIMLPVPVAISAACVGFIILEVLKIRAADSADDGVVLDLGA